MSEQLYTPLYPPTGSPCRGFVCEAATAGKICGAVTKTRRGMLLHLQLKHRIVLQPNLEMETEAVAT